LLATPPADCLRGLLVGRSLVEFALRYCQVLIELAKPRQIAGGQLHPRRGMTAGPEEEIALLMRPERVTELAPHEFGEETNQPA
jgi:hypothetical protein